MENAKANHLNTLGSTKLHNTVREDLDFYQTPAYAVKTLVERFDFKTDFIWEPMAGNGAIAKHLIDAGYSVYSTDIVERSYKLNDTLDFFKTNSFSVSGDDGYSIVTNPPYALANEFLIHALRDIKPRTCCLFLPVRYLEGRKRYNAVYTKFKPSKVFVYAQRLGCFKESDVEAGLVGERGVGSAVAYMWLCFDSETMLDKATKTEIEWIP